MINFDLNNFIFLEIKDRVFHVEIIVSAIITTFVYGIQLFLGMKNFREGVKEWRAGDQTTLIKQKRISIQGVGSKAIQYPGYLLRYTIGGFVITFHLLIFIAVIPRFLFRYYYAFKSILEFISPLLIFYALQWHLTRYISGFIDVNNPTNGNNAIRSHWKNILKNILLYFILVSSKTLQI